MLKFAKTLGAKDIVYNKYSTTPASLEDRFFSWVDRKSEYLKETYAQKIRVQKKLDQRNARRMPSA